MPITTFNTVVGIGTIIITLVTVSSVIFYWIIGKNSSLLKTAFNYAVPIGFFLALSSVVGSLIYSEYYQLPPCLYCWWQRIFLYPIAILFAVTWYRSVRQKISSLEIFYPATVLSSIASAISLYHIFLQQGIITRSGACLQNGVSCTIIDIQIFGVITIPMMAFVLGIALTALGIFVIRYQKNTSE
jgi:disulfide bond formation protein DsbB